jgi:hypothetical protein
MTVALIRREYPLVALAGCITTAMVYQATARGVSITLVDSKLVLFRTRGFGIYLNEQIAIERRKWNSAPKAATA